MTSRAQPSSPVRQAAFRWQWQAAILASDLAPTSRFVALVLCAHMDDDGLCWPGLATIARESGLDRTTVARRLGALDALGWVRRDRSKGGRAPGGKARRTEYQGLIPGPNSGRAPLLTVAENPVNSGTVPRSTVAERHPNQALELTKEPAAARSPDGSPPPWVALGIPRRRYFELRSWGREEIPPPPAGPAEPDLDAAVRAMLAWESPGEQPPGARRGRRAGSASGPGAPTEEGGSTMTLHRPAGRASTPPPPTPLAPTAAELDSFRPEQRRAILEEADHDPTMARAMATVIEVFGPEHVEIVEEPQ